jgi:hypothetical protein
MGQLSLAKGAEETVPRFSMFLTDEQSAKLALLTEDPSVGQKKVKIPQVTGIRALLQASSPGVEYLGVVRRLHEAERALVKETRGKSKGKAKKKSPFPMVLTKEQHTKLGALAGFCHANSVSASKGTLVRALIEMAEPSAEFSAYVRRAYDREREHWYMERHGSS